MFCFTRLLALAYVRQVQEKVRSECAASSLLTEAGVNPAPLFLVAPGHTEDMLSEARSEESAVETNLHRRCKCNHIPPVLHNPDVIYIAELTRSTSAFKLAASIQRPYQR